MLPLVVVAVVMVTALVTVVTDVGALWLSRRSLQATVDGAALAGARAVDLAAIYAGGSTGDLALDPPAVRVAVRDYTRAIPSVRELAGFRVVSVRVSGAVVTVRANALVRLPFVALVTGRSIVITAEASARTSVG